MSHGGRRTGSEPAYPLQDILSGQHDDNLPCYASDVAQRKQVNSDYVVMCSKCLRFKLANDGLKQCKRGTGCNINAGKSGGKSTSSVADRMFDTMAAAKSVRDAAREVLLGEQKEKEDYLAAEERQGNIKKTNIVERAWTAFTSWFSGKLSSFYVPYTLCVCVCVCVCFYSYLYNIV